MKLANLFEGHQTLRAVIDAVLEGHLGLTVTDEEDQPRAARLDIGCYAIFGGDAAASRASELVAEVAPPRELLVPDDQAWRDLLALAHGARLTDRPMRTFSTHTLERERLRAMAEDVPGGFELRRLDVALAEQLSSDLEPHGCQTYESPADFVEHGLGFGVARDGRLVSASTSYTRSTRRVEVAVATHPDFQGRGLARIAASALLGHCLDEGLNPEWSASNPISKQLALSLGYSPGALCDIIYLS